jgi:hypothetical protein
MQNVDALDRDVQHLKDVIEIFPCEQKQAVEQREGPPQRVTPSYLKLNSLKAVLLQLVTELEKKDW